MIKDEAFEISEWRYEPPYSFYDMKADRQDLEEFLTFESSERKFYYSVVDENEELVGFFEFEQARGKVEIGLGMRPDLTGKGLGLTFLNAGIEFAKEKFKPDFFSLSVARFNKRAIKVYEKAGFSITRKFINETNGGRFEFVEMVKSVEMKPND